MQNKEFEELFNFCTKNLNQEKISQEEAISIYYENIENKNFK